MFRPELRTRTLVLFLESTVLPVCLVCLSFAAIFVHVRRSALKFVLPMTAAAAGGADAATRRALGNGEPASPPPLLLQNSLPIGCGTATPRLRHKSLDREASAVIAECELQIIDLKPNDGARCVRDSEEKQQTPGAEAPRSFTATSVGEGVRGADSVIAEEDEVETAVRSHRKLSKMNSNDSRLTINTVNEVSVSRLSLSNISTRTSRRSFRAGGGSSDAFSSRGSRNNSRGLLRDLKAESQHASGGERVLSLHQILLERLHVRNEHRMSVSSITSTARPSIDTVALQAEADEQREAADSAMRRAQESASARLLARELQITKMFAIVFGVMLFGFLYVFCCTELNCSLIQHVEY